MSASLASHSFFCSAERLLSFWTCETASSHVSKVPRSPMTIFPAVCALSRVNLPATDAPDLVRSEGSPEMPLAVFRMSLPAWDGCLEGPALVAYCKIKRAALFTPEIEDIGHSLVGVARPSWNNAPVFSLHHVGKLRRQMKMLPSKPLRKHKPASCEPVAKAQNPRQFYTTAPPPALEP